MKKTLGIFGATGTQGGSVLKGVLLDPALADQYNVRVITRDPQSTAARALQEDKRVHVVQGDMADPSSLDAALKGVDFVFIVSAPSFAPNGRDIEFGQVKAAADAAVKASAQYIIFSTLPSPSELSNGKHTEGAHQFEAKAQAEKYIRSLPIASAFVSVGFYMENFAAMPFLSPKKVPGEEAWEITRFQSPHAQLPLIDASGDIGKFVGAILADPESFKGQTLCTAEKMYDLEETVRIMSETTGKTVRYRQVSREEWTDSLPFGKDVLPGAFGYQEHYGYWGSDSARLLADSVARARGKPSSLTEFFRAHPLHLQ